MPDESPAGGTRPTILCIDDDPIVLNFLRGLLELHGYRTFTAAYGPQGLALAEQHQPDVILLDVLMMFDMNGFEICRKLRAIPALHATPIIFLTVLEDSQTAAAAKEAGATATLRKPADPDTILTTIERFLRRRAKPNKAQKKRCSDEHGDTKPERPGCAGGGDGSDSSRPRDPGASPRQE